MPETESHSHLIDDRAALAIWLTHSPTSQPLLLRKLWHGECQCVRARELCGGNVHVDNED